MYLVCGRIRLRLQLDDGVRDTEVGPGEAMVVPRGIWHRIFIEEPGRLVHITPGRRDQHRPLSGT
jgi:mannose-6-phosphate isomerase-like protein (cupin superfamily)